MQKRLDEGTYDLIEIAWGGMVDGDLAPILGGKDPRIDPAAQADPGRLRLWRALEEMAAAWDPAERSKLSGELVAALAEVWPIAGIVADAPQGLVHRRVQGLKVWDGWFDLSALKLDPST